MTEKLDPFDVAALERSLNDSATRVSTVWVSYLIFALYLVIATGTATHRQLVLEEPLKLPALNVDLPLYWFFILAPILFALFHFYVLLQVLLLGRTAAAYDQSVSGKVGSPTKSPIENELIRQRLANTLFAQIFAGSRREREGSLGWLFKAIAWVTLVLAPIFVVLAFLFVFLPYHSHLATWTHRLLLLAELAIAFLLWPRVLDGRRDFDLPKLLRRVLRRAKRTAAILFRLLSAKDLRSEERHWLRLQTVPVVACILFVAVSFWLTSFPGEPHVNLFMMNSLSAVQCNRRIIPPKFDRLVLRRDVEVVDYEKLHKIEMATKERRLPPSQGERTRSLPERDLRCGVFDSANLGRTDFAGAQFEGANLRSAHLEGADLGEAHLQRANLASAHLQGAYLGDAKLQGADLGGAHLQCSDHPHCTVLSRAHLQGANLTGADLGEAYLEGADLSGAKLQGAFLGKAHLQGANLIGADLSEAYLEGADLSGAKLQGAFLGEAHLQGANLKSARLEGAYLREARLQGADLKDATLNLSLLSDAYLWRAQHASCSDARVTSPRFDKILEPPSDPIPLQSATPEGLGATIPQRDLDATEANWKNCAADSEKVPESAYLQQHSNLLRDLVCNATINRKEVAEGIIAIWMSDFSDHRDYLSRLARGLLNGRDCAATKDLSDQIKERLRKFATPEPAK
jgi:uncharacterized protein YjbI with pentapeptide repeats